MIETFYIYYQQDDYWVLLTQIEDTLFNTLKQLYSYPQDKQYKLEKITQIGSQIINFEF